jgi:hypothetical protein
MDEGRTDILGSGALVLVGLLQPLVPIFVQICTRSVESTIFASTVESTM